MFVVLQAVFDIGGQGRVAPALEDAPVGQRGLGGGAIRPAPAACGGLAREAVAAVQAQGRQHAQGTDHGGGEDHRVQHHRLAKQLRAFGDDQAGEHPAKTVAQRIARYLAIDIEPGFEGLGCQFGGAVPAQERAAMVGIAVALDVTEPQVEGLGQQRQHRLIGHGAETVAVQEVQQRLARRRGAQAAQGEAFGTGVRPGKQLHGASGQTLNTAGHCRWPGP